MKKLILISSLMIGLVFNACQKNEPSSKIENLNSNQSVASEQNTLPKYDDVINYYLVAGFTINSTGLNTESEFSNYLDVTHLVKNNHYVSIFKYASYNDVPPLDKVACHQKHTPDTDTTSESCIGTGTTCITQLIYGSSFKYKILTCPS